VRAPQVGEVIPYSYLWAREREAGEESGRKVRPCVVVVAVQPVGKDAVLVVVAPITSQHPKTGDAAIEMPGALRAALKLDASPSWVICNEVNQFVWPGFDLGRTPEGAQSYGRIPGSFLQQIRAEIVKVRAKAISRDEDG
jgi:hypothetical protein